MIELPKGPFGCILADPPWQFKSFTALQSQNWDSRRDVEKHYPVMSLDDIKAMPVREIAAKDSHLFLWVTGPCIPWGLEVLKAWGFKFSTLAHVWIKLKRSHQPDQLRFVPTIDSEFHVGLGLTTRKNAELVLLGRRGNARRNAKDVRELILAPVRRHSQKPDEIYERIERYCDGPYLDLFSRQSRPGWTAFGNEAGKFDPAPTKQKGIIL